MIVAKIALFLALGAGALVSAAHAGFAFEEKALLPLASWSAAALGCFQGALTLAAILAEG